MPSCNIDFVNEWELKYQGAESRIYFGLHPKSNNRCVIKYRFSKKYRHPILDKKLTKERTKRERRMIEKLTSKSNDLACYMPKVVWSDDCTIIMTEITNCETIYTYIENSLKTDKTNLDNLAPLVGKCIAEMHNIGIIHGDLTTSNLLLCPRLKKYTDNDHSLSANLNKKVKVLELDDSSHIVVPIDFGLSTGSLHPEERAVDLYVLERALLSTHFSDSDFFNKIFETYLNLIDEKTCEGVYGKHKILERLEDVRARGRKSDYSSSQEG